MLEYDQLASPNLAKKTTLSALNFTAKNVLKKAWYEKFFRLKFDFPESSKVDSTSKLLRPELDFSASATLCSKCTLFRPKFDLSTNAKSSLKHHAC